ncbi:MAG TPA: four helix bundle protein [Anaerolineales bacterium]|jgi:four helix bundle protein
MAETKYAKSHRDLIVYQKARILAQEIFALTKGFPREETYSLTDQVRRSSRSIGAQIAEAWAKRRYEKHFVSKLTDADAEQHETQHWIETARDCGYVSQAQASMLVDKCRELGRLLGSIIDKASSFCNPPTHSIRESQSDYFVTEN